MLSWVWLVTLHVYVSIKRRTTTPPIKYFWICPCNWNVICQNVQLHDAAKKLQSLNYTILSLPPPGGEDNTFKIAYTYHDRCILCTLPHL